MSGCDLRGGASRVVKGTRFLDLRDAGDPVECAVAYNDQGADELVFLDITASSDARRSMVEVVARTAEKCFMPLTVGGGIRTVGDMREMLLAGADKVSINTAAIREPALVDAGSEAFGSQCIVVAIDAKRNPDGASLERVTHAAAGIARNSTRSRGRVRSPGAEPAKFC